MAGWYRAQRTRLPKISILGWPFSSPLSLRGRAHPLLKATVVAALLALLFAVSPIFSSRSSDSRSSSSLPAVPVWLSLSFVSRPSLILAGSYSSELSPSGNSTSPAKENLNLSQTSEQQQNNSYAHDFDSISPARAVESASSSPSSTSSSGSSVSRRPVFPAESPSNSPSLLVETRTPTLAPEWIQTTDDNKRVGSGSAGAISMPQETNSPGREQSVDIKGSEKQRRDEDSKDQPEGLRQEVVHADKSSGTETTVGATKSAPINFVSGVSTGTEQRTSDFAVEGPAGYMNGSGPEPAASHRPLISTPSSTGTDTRGGKSFPKITENELLDRRKRIEQELLIAKQAIENASPADSDPSLYSLVYRNVSTFSKSYKLMEDMFRVYVYREGDKALVHRGPMRGIYCSEGRFIDRMERGSSFREQDPEKAHVYFLPYSVTEMTLTIYVEGSSSMEPLNTFVKNYVNEVASKHPFWNRTRGADHFFVSCHDWGPATARDHPELRTNAMKVVCNADLREEYVLGKDASLPEIYLHKKKLKLGGPAPIRRTFLAFFAGHMHGSVRPTLLELWKDKDPDMKIYEMLPKEIERRMNYEQHMKNSKYCICAAGFEVNSPRIVESIYYDCVPVIIADHFVLPFSDVLNWDTFSVTLPQSEIPNLKSILTSIPEKQYRAMQKRLSKVRQHFIWNDESPVKYDVFHMILHSVWTSRLNRLDPQLTVNLPQPLS